MLDEHGLREAAKNRHVQITAGIGGIHLETRLGAGRLLHAGDAVGVRRPVLVRGLAELESPERLADGIGPSRNRYEPDEQVVVFVKDAGRIGYATRSRITE